MEKSMKYQNLISELNNIQDSAIKLQHVRKEKLELYLGQFKSMEKNLRKELKKHTNKTNRRKLINELEIVKKAYATLGSNGIKIHA